MVWENVPSDVTESMFSERLSNEPVTNSRLSLN